MKIWRKLIPHFSIVDPLPVETTVAAHWAVCESIRGAPYLPGIRGKAELWADGLSDECPTAVATRYIGSLSPRF